MTKKIIFGAMLCIAAISVFIACDKKDKEEVVDKVTIYGTVVDANDGSPIPNVQIAVYKDYLSEEQQKEDMNNGGTPGALGSTVTGSDGSFEFAISNLDRKYSYFVFATKTGYQDGEVLLSLSNLEAGGKFKSDFQLTKNDGAFMVVDDHKKEISTIDFGSNPGTTMRSVTLVYKGSDKLLWDVKYDAAWIKSISPSYGTLYQGDSKAIVITIDRSNLAEGSNSTLIHISSDKGNREITVTAQNGISGYFIKHPWGGGEWSWFKMSKENDMYVHTGIWGGEGANINTEASDEGAQWYPESAIQGGQSVSFGQQVKFIYNPSNEILKVQAK